MTATMDHLVVDERRASTMDHLVVDERRASTGKCRKEQRASAARPTPDRPEPQSAVKAPQRRSKGARRVEPAQPELASRDDPPRSTHRPPGSANSGKLTRLRRREYLLFAPYDPCRTLDWRWRSALDIAQSERRILTDLDPPEVVDAVRYLRAQAQNDRDDGDHRWADLDAAFQLAQLDEPRRWEVEARILARQTDETIAAHVGLSPTTIRLFETLFYNVRDSLDASDRVLLRAIGWVACMSRPPTVGELWKGFGYNGGAHVLELVIATTMDRPLPAWTRTMPGAGDPTFEERLRLRCRLAVDGMMLPVDMDPLKLGRLHLDLLAREAAQRDEEPAYGLQTRVEQMLAETTLQPQAPPAGDAQAAVVA
jgi:hypothetical protein